MVIPTPIDNGNGAVINVIHHDGRSTVNTIGPFDTTDDAVAYAEKLGVSNKRLRISNLTPP